MPRGLPSRVGGLSLPRREGGASEVGASGAGASAGASSSSRVGASTADVVEWGAALLVVGWLAMGVLRSRA